MNQESNFTDTLAHLMPKEQNGRLIQAPEKVITTIQYCLYARKSSEDDERQALSIDSQIKEMAIQAQREGLLVTDIRKESHSAKATGQRPVLNQLIADIRSGLFQGILTWAPDRLSRNAGDLGSLVDLMDNGYLREIHTHGQTFTANPNDKFMLMILCSQAKLENDNRGINVKRGQKTKCEMGFRPNFAPLGYLNDYYSGKGMKKVFVDKPRAPIIKKIFEKVGYENFSGRAIHNWLKNETKFRSRNGKVLGVSVIYKMLNNPYYAGYFTYGGKWYKGSYEPIISRELFDLVQKKMVVAPKSKPGTKIFDFTRILKCGSCGSGITAQEKFKILQNGGKNRYVYYHCTKSRDHRCKQPYVKEEILISEFISLLEQVPVEIIKAETSMGEKLEIFRQFSAIREENDDQSALSKFLRHIFQDGSKKEKRELISCIKGDICLDNNQIIVG